MRLLLILYIYFISLIFRTLAQRIPIAPLDNTGDSVSKYRYGELAETEFHRPGYFPVPFVVGGSVKSNGLATSQTDQVRPIPQTDLSELIRSHIAHRRRLKQLTHLDNNGSGTPILTGVKRVTELRQTPYRRFPTNSSSLSYAEKRRRWKAELRRRLKAPPRFLASPPPPPVLISEPTNNVEGEERYYVTYSPHNRIYQVSRRPPPYLYNIQTDRLPDSTDFAAPVTTIPVTQAPIGESVGTQFSNTVQPSTGANNQDETEAAEEEEYKSTLSPIITTTEFYRPQEEEEYEDVKESSTPSSAILIKWTASTSPSSTPLPPTTASTTEIPTTTVPPPIFIIQRGEALPINTPSQQQVKVAAVKPTLKMPLFKQILHLDDYDQDMEDEEEEEEQQPVQTYHYPSITTPVPQPTPEIVQPTQTNNYIQPNGKRPDLPPVVSRPAAAPQAVEPDEEDEEDDDDFFFWKPGGAAVPPPSAGGSPPRSEAQHSDPFEIVAHQESVSKRRLI